MSFDAAWLSLRAGADDAARAPALLDAAVAWAQDHRPCRILDIGSGTGATRRAFGNRVPGAHWWLCDNDPILLSHCEAEDATPLVLDLAHDLDRAFAVAPQLVTASAFFDLAGAAWIDAMVSRLTAAGAALYAPLTYDGLEVWQPPHAEDATVARAFLADMRRDKGLGAALGHCATTRLAESLKAEGYAVTLAPSPWRLTVPQDRALIEALAMGKAEAAQASPAWRAARCAAVSAMVGHTDLWATPPRS